MISASGGETDFRLLRRDVRAIGMTAPKAITVKPKVVSSGRIANHTKPNAIPTTALRAWSQFDRAVRASAPTLGAGGTGYHEAFETQHA